MHSKLNLKSLGLAVLILVAVLFSGSSASAAITVNGTITSTEATNANSLTWSHTVAAGTDRVLFVELAISNNNSLVTGVAYGGVALTQVGRGEGNHAVEIWLLIDPAVGTANVVASFTAATAAVGGATTFNGVSQSTPTGSFGSSSGTGTTGSVTVPSATGDLVIDVQYWHGDISGGPGAGQTINWFEQNATHFGASTRKDGASSVVMSASVTTGSTEWEYGAVSIKASSYTVYGNVFEDVNYGGGAGRNWATASGNGGSARPAARVELFDAAGAFVTSTTTDGSGNYSFANVAAGNYTVRCVSSSVTSVRTGYAAALRPVQTYRTNAATGTAVDVTDYVGGHDPATADAGNAAAGWVLNSSTGVFSGSGAGKAHAFAPVTVGAADVNGVNFGWNFDTIVNTNDSVQGSLRQFITNANTLGGDASLVQSGLVSGKENAVFMISNGTAAAGLRAANNYFTGGAATITSVANLPAISSAVVINAQKQPGWSGPPVVAIDGTGAGAGADGLYLDAGSAGSTVRGLVIAGFDGRGVYVADSNNTIAGNYIGTSVAGNSAMGNLVGVFIRGATGNLVGGTGSYDGNVISGNTVDGIQILNAAASGNLIQGNLIGLNAAGTAALANANQGIAVFGGAHDNTIGGTTAEQRNVISGNGNEGIRIADTGTTGNAVIGNYIGTNAAGTAGFANAVGVHIFNGANNTAIGGSAAGAGNVVAYNTSIGVSIANNTNATTGAGVLGNSIFSNGTIGIDLVANGVTVNNGTKNAGLPNYGMDHPVFISANLSGTTLAIDGYVGSAANQATFANARVEVFTSDDDATGYGEGRTYLGFLTSDANGNFSGSLDVTGKGLNSGDKITGTATDGSNNTSEFGPNVLVSPLTLAIVKQVWEPTGSAPLGSPVSAPAGASLVFLIYVKNTTTIPVTDIRINDLLDQTGFDYVSGSLVRTLAASPPSDTATDKQIFDATDPGTGTALSDNLDGDAGSALDTGAPAGVDRITIGAVTGQANGSLTINAHTTFALRFNVKIK